MVTFTNYVRNTRLLEQIITNSDTLEDFFEGVENNGMKLETVMTGDICTNFAQPLSVTYPTNPITRLKRKEYESAPPTCDAEKWILDNKSAFKKKYNKKDYLQILYATAWHLYNKGYFKDKK